MLVTSIFSLSCYVFCPVIKDKPYHLNDVEFVRSEGFDFDNCRTLSCFKELRVKYCDHGKEILCGLDKIPLNEIEEVGDWT